MEVLATIGEALLNIVALFLLTIAAIISIAFALVWNDETGINWLGVGIVAIFGLTLIIRIAGFFKGSGKSSRGRSYNRGGYANSNTPQSRAACCYSSNGRRKVNFDSYSRAQSRAHQYGGSVYECQNNPGTYHHTSG